MTEVKNAHLAMSEYEAAAWTKLIERVRRREQRQQVAPIRKAAELGDAASKRLETYLDDHQQVKTVADSVLAPLTGLQNLLSRAATASVSDRRIIKRAGRLDSAVTSLTDIRKADLAVPDRLLSLHTLTYGVGLGVEGAATSLLITGFVVSSTVSGGTTLAAAAAAVSTDVAANLAAASRLVAKVAMSYGYDTRLPEEQLYALGVLNYGTTLTAGGKAASLAELSRLVQTMMRGANHRVLDEFVMVQVSREVVKRLGFRLTHQRIAQVVPIVGAVVNAGTNATSITILGQRAQEAYRLRFLTEKYDIDPHSWLGDHVIGDDEGAEEPIDIEALVEDARSNEQTNTNANDNDNRP
ncbi:EcsC family protein [uncultured Friedmanniella sp.]|uniref:EcsC family protein n=1 Tax=uncultured Friedmanniella sp. TaxID=335381 RepID=UPI0035C9D631